MKKLLEKLFERELGAFAETIFGGLFGILFGYILGDVTIGVTIFGIGCLISLSRYYIYGYFAKEFKDAFRLYQMKDKIYNLNDENFVNELIKSERGFFHRLQQLTEGTIEYKTVGEYLKEARNQVRKTKRCMKAIVLVGSKEWDEDGTLKEYLDEQIKAIKDRRIKAARIFLLDKNQISDKNQINDKNILNIMKMHADGGIEVYYAEKENISENVPEILTEAFVIYDDEVAFVGKVSCKTNKIITGYKTIDNIQIVRLKDVFNELKLNYSTKFKNESNSLSNETNNMEI